MARNKPTNPAERTKLNAMISMQQDCSLPKMHIDNSFSREALAERFQDVDQAHGVLSLQKDEFYKAQLLEMKEVNKLQVAAYKASKGDKPELMSGSLADYIRARLDFKESKFKQSEGDVKKLKTQHKVPDSPFACIFFRAMVQDATNDTEYREVQSKWKRVDQFIAASKPSMPYLTMGLFCHEAGAKDKAIVAIRKEKNPTAKIELLINIEAWKEAVEESYILEKKDPDQTDYYFQDILIKTGGAGGLGDKFIRECKPRKR